MKYEYKTVDLSTEAGIKKAERLVNEGWKQIVVGFITVTYERLRVRK